MGAFPSLIAHADWSVTPSKRWLSSALRRRDRYEVTHSAPVTDATTLLQSLLREADGGTVLIGFDFPIGLPLAYARAAGIRRFLGALRRFGDEEWSDFYSVAREPREISIRRPFYPFMPGGRSRQQLLDGLKLKTPSDLYRCCERSAPGRAAASCLFWTLGAKQSGRAAIAGWRDVLQPALKTFGRDVALWPFDGPLQTLLASRRIVICEAYPANAYRRIGLLERSARWSKRRPSDRRALAPRILDWADRQSIRIPPDLGRRALKGFGSQASGEDAFDSMLGLLSMIAEVQQPDCSPIPLPAAHLAVEGWMLGYRM